MLFESPLFLWAISVISIPILLHLFNLRRYKKVYFTNVSWLQNVEQKNKSTRNIRNLLVLICRCLAIIFLVLAFAQPFIPNNKNEITNRKKVSFYIDNSFSMQLQNTRGPLLEVSKNTVADIIKTYPAGTLFNLVTNDFDPTYETFTDKDKILNALPLITYSPITKTTNEVLKRIDKTLENDKGIIYVLSDFQKNMVSENGVDSSKNEIYFIPFTPESKANILIDSVWIENPVIRQNQSLKINYKIKNHGEANLENLTVELFVNEQKKSVSSIAVSADSSAVASIVYNPSEAGWQNAFLAINDQDITYDDTMYFSFPVISSIEVGYITEQKNEKNISSVFKTEPLFIAENLSNKTITTSDIENKKSILVSGVPGIKPELLQQQVSKGGILCLFPPSDETKLSAFNQYLSNLNIPQLDNIVKTEENVKLINTEHPVFSYDKKFNFSDVKVKQYYTSVSNGLNKKEWLMKLNNGDELFSEFSVGKGKVILSYAALDTSFTNLALQPAFVILLLNMSFTKNTGIPLYASIGNTRFYPVYNLVFNDENLPTLENKETRIIPQLSLIDGSVFLGIPEVIHQSGTYQLKTNDGKTNSVLAFNYNRKESEPATFSEDELELYCEKNNFKMLNGTKSNIASQVATQTQNKTFWKHCILFALLFIFVEILLLRFFKVS